mgnify:CR=1 FL=1
MADDTVTIEVGAEFCDGWPDAVELVNAETGERATFERSGVSDDAE